MLRCLKIFKSLKLFVSVDKLYPCATRLCSALAHVENLVRVCYALCQILLELSSLMFVPFAQLLTLMPVLFALVSVSLAILVF
jgi:hypothetical protein